MIVIMIASTAICVMMRRRCRDQKGNGGRKLRYSAHPQEKTIIMEVALDVPSFQESTYARTQNRRRRARGRGEQTVIRDYLLLINYVQLCPARYKRVFKLVVS